MKAFSSAAFIQAAPETVWALLTDAPRYPQWNPTVTKVEGSIAPGAKVVVHAAAPPNQAFPVKVTAFDAPRRMVWSGGMPFGLFRGERVFELVRVEHGTRFSMRETFTGPLASLIERSIPDLKPAFDAFATALKRTAERRS